MKQILNLLIILCAMSCYNSLQAQQEPMFTKYMFNSLILNPGFTGSHLGVKASATYRHQWAAFSGAPRTYWVGGDAAFGEQKKARFGLALGHDKTGVNTLTAIFGNYAYGLQINRESELAIGLKAGGYIYRTDPTKLQNVETGDPLYQSVNSAFIPVFGTGVYYHYQDEAYVGASVPSLAVIYPDNKAITSGFLKRHFYLHGGYMFQFGSGVDKSKLKLAGLLKFQSAAPVQLDVGATYYFDFDLGLGVGYRSGDAAYANIEIPLGEHLYIGYAYDFTLTQIRRYSKGVHEIMIGYLRPGEELGINTPTQWFR